MKIKKWFMCVLSCLVVMLFSHLKIHAITIETNTGEVFEITESEYTTPLGESEQNISDKWIKDIEPIKANPKMYINTITSENDREKIIGTDDLMVVKDSLSYPYSTSALVTIVDNIGNESYRGSANFIAPNVLITAAHNVYSREGGYFYSEIKVKPAANHLDKYSEPFGEYVAKVYMVEKYKSVNSSESKSNDFALLVIDAPVGLQTGTLGVYGEEKDFLNTEVSITGYPAYNYIERMYTGNGKVLKDTGADLCYDVDTLGGSSGSAVYDNNWKVVAVHAYGSNINSGPKLNTAKLAFVNKIINQSGSDQGWVKKNNKWYFYQEGKMSKGWVSTGGKWYYFNSAGEMQTGWFEENGKTYYLKKTGEMAIGE